MSQSYRFRYANEIAGGFVLLCLGLLVIGIYTAGHAQGWFQKKLVLKVRFDADKGTYGLQEGAEVRVLGTPAGWVDEIRPGMEERGLETSLILQGKFKRFIRTDSIAKVKKKFEVAGDAYVEITLGDVSRPMMESGDAIPCIQDEELIQAAKKMVDDFRRAAVPMLDEFTGILSNAYQISSQIEKHQGVAGRLIGDPQWAAEVEGVVKDVRRTAEHLPVLAARIDGVITNVDAMAASLKDTAAGFPAIRDTAAGAVQDIRVVTGGLTGQVANVQAVLLQAEGMLRDTQILVEGLQKHWLVRDYIPEVNATPMAAPMPVAGERGRP